MHLLQKIILTFFLACAISTTPAALAAGKIENATLAEIKDSINTTIERSEKTLAAIESGADKEAVIELLSSTKQMAKEIHATRKSAVYKSKAGTQMKKARSAAKKDDLEKAKGHVIKGIEYYKNLKVEFWKSNG